MKSYGSKQHLEISKTIDDGEDEVTRITTDLKFGKGISPARKHTHMRQKSDANANMKSSKSNK